MLQDITFVLGGAASGKSALAETIARSHGCDRVYIATAQAFDDEMRAKIARHRADREGDGWRTVEAPRDLAAAVRDTHADVILVDCLTMWLSNLVLDSANLSQPEAELEAALDWTEGAVIVVSNEVGLGIVPDNALSRRFRAAQGGLNKRMARRADRVVGVMAGCPIALKGDLPACLT